MNCFWESDICPPKYVLVKSEKYTDLDGSSHELKCELKLRNDNHIPYSDSSTLTPKTPNSTFISYERREKLWIIM